MKQNFFDKKDLDCSYNPIYPTLFCWLLQFLLLATIKIYEQQALNSFLSLLSNLFLYPYNNILKIFCVHASRQNGKFNFENSNSTQVCLKMDLGILDSESAPKIPCVPIVSQNGQFWFFQSKFGEIAQLCTIIWF